VVEGEPAGERTRDGPVAGRRILVLGAGPAQLGLLAAARDRGLFVIAVDRDPSAPGFEYADRRAIVSVEDEEAVDRLARAENVDGLIAPGIDWPVAIAARVAARLGVAHPLDPETALLATSKLRQRHRFSEHGVPQPTYELCHDFDEARAASKRIGFPCVVKAPDRQGQRGLALVRGRQELEPAVLDAIDTSRSGACLVEQYALGREVTVNAFSVAGRFFPLTVTDRDVAPPPAFGVALAHVWPTTLEPTQVGAVVDTARAATEAVGVREGPTYTQVLATPEGPRVAELAARLGGGHDAELCAFALGIDLNGLALAAALGEPTPPVAGRPRVGGATTAFVVPPSGELLGLEGVEDAERSEGVVWVRVYRRPGHRFGELRIGADRAGAVQAVGESRAEAYERARSAAALIRFQTDAALV
jgi:biotin carboxylase